MHTLATMRRYVTGRATFVDSGVRRSSRREALIPAARAAASSDSPVVVDPAREPTALAPASPSGAPAN